jgi:hypothetical protein
MHRASVFRRAPRHAGTRLAGRSHGLDARAGNFTLVGSVANLIVAEQVRSHGVTISFRTYFAVGAPHTPGELPKTGVPHCNAARRAKQFHLVRHALNRTGLARLPKDADGHARGPRRTPRSYRAASFGGAAPAQQCRALRGPGMTLWRVCPG